MGSVVCYNQHDSAGRSAVYYIWGIMKCSAEKD